MINDPKIWVCDQCHMRTCWEGIFLCEESRNAGIVLKTKAELDNLNLEHPSYYEPIFAAGGES